LAIFILASALESALTAQPGKAGHQARYEPSVPRASRISSSIVGSLSNFACPHQLEAATEGRVRNPTLIVLHERYGSIGAEPV
jgi:hypothetical protein